MFWYLAYTLFDRSLSTFCEAALRPPNPQSPIIIFAYCRYSDHVTPVEILRGLIVQLLHQAPQDLPPVERLRETHRLQDTKPTLSESSHLLKELLETVPNAGIIIDGLDELEDRDDAGLLLDELFTFPARIMICSRPMPLYQAEFLGTVLSIDARNEDIVTFVQSGIKANRGLSSLLKGTRGLDEEIVEKICAKSQGM